jgi:hypothetical protein
MAPLNMQVRYYNESVLNLVLLWFDLGIALLVEIEVVARLDDLQLDEELANELGRKVEYGIIGAVDLLEEVLPFGLGARRYGRSFT